MPVMSVRLRYETCDLTDKRGRQKEVRIISCRRRRRRSSLAGPDTAPEAACVASSAFASGTMLPPARAHQPNRSLARPFRPFSASSRINLPRYYTTLVPDSRVPTSTAREVLRYQRDRHHEEDSRSRLTITSTQPNYSADICTEEAIKQSVCLPPAPLLLFTI